MIALCAALLAAFAFAFGNLGMKRGLDRLADANSGPWACFRSPLWWLGMGLTATGVVLNYGATAIGEVSVVQPIVSLNPVVTVALGALLLKESLGVYRVWAILLFVGGVVALALPTEGWQLPQIGFWQLMLMSGILAVIAMVVFYKNLALCYAIVGGLGFGLTPLLFKVSFTEFEAWQIGQAALPWIEIGFFISIYVGSFMCIQGALWRGQLAIVIPISAGVGMVLSTLTGILVLNEPMGWAKMVGFLCMGLALRLFRP